MEITRDRPAEVDCRSWFRLFFALNVLGLVLVLVGCICIEPQILDRANAARATLWTPVDFDGCLSEYKDPKDSGALQRALTLLESTVKNRNRGIVYTTLPRYKVLTAGVLVFFALAVLNLANMEFPYSLCYRRRYEEGGVPEPLFSFGVYRVGYNFGIKVLMAVMSCVALFLTEALDCDVTCKDIVEAASKADLDLATDDGVLPTSGVISSCSALLQGCGIKVSVVAPSTQVSAPALLLSAGNMLIFCALVSKWYAWVKHIADTLEQPLAQIEPPERDGNEFIRRMELRRARRIERILAGELTLSVGQQPRRREVDRHSRPTRRQVIPLPQPEYSALIVKDATPRKDTDLDDISKVSRDSDTTEIDCVICLEEVVQNGQAESLPCGHVFHQECIALWLKQSVEANCPICRAPVQ